MVRKYLILQSNKDIPLLSCQDIRNLYDEFISDEIIREDPEDQPDGEIFRKSPVHIDNGHGDRIHEGLFPESKIITAMDSALSILNNENYDILIRVALYHYFFGYIHPFYNGNGRMTRFISSYMLSRFFSKSACLRISYVIKENRRKYYELF
jgi:Fic family protein